MGLLFQVLSPFPLKPVVRFVSSCTSTFPVLSTIPPGESEKVAPCCSAPSQGKAMSPQHPKTRLPWAQSWELYCSDAMSCAYALSS